MTSEVMLPKGWVLREDEAARSFRIQAIRKQFRKGAWAFFCYGMLIGLIWCGVVTLVTSEMLWSSELRPMLVMVFIGGIGIYCTQFIPFRYARMEWRIHGDGIALHASERHPRLGLVPWRQIKRLEYTPMETPTCGSMITLIFARPWLAGAPHSITVSKSEESLREIFSGYPVIVSAVRVAEGRE